MLAHWLQSPDPQTGGGLSLLGGRELNLDTVVILPSFVTSPSFSKVACAAVVLVQHFHFRRRFELFEGRSGDQLSMLLMMMMLLLGFSIDRACFSAFP